MSNGGTGTTSVRGTGAFRRPTEAWAVDAERRRHVTELLDALPLGFVVFHDVPLPKPSAATVDHLVIGPRSVWAVTAVSYTEAVVVGTGRGADTLWAGHRPLRSVLERCETHADALAGVIEHPVEPMLCLDVPSVPQPMFDFHGITIASPDSLADAVATTTTDWHDVAVVEATICRLLAIEPARRTILPTLGTTTTSPTAQPQRGSRSGPARAIAAIRQLLPTRRLVPIVAIVIMLTVIPNVVGLGTSVAQRGVEVGVGSVTDVLTPSTLVLEAAANDRAAVDAVASMSDPPGVWYVVTCPDPGAGWSVSWVWPGDLPDGAASYGVRTRAVDGEWQDRTLVGWAGPDSAPPPSHMDAVDDVVVMTEYRDDGGITIASTEEPLRSPAGSC